MSIIIAVSACGVALQQSLRTLRGFGEDRGKGPRIGLVNIAPMWRKKQSMIEAASGRVDGGIPCA